MAAQQYGQRGQMTTPKNVDWLYRTKQSNLMERSDDLLNSLAQRFVQDRQGAADAASQSYANRYETWSGRVVPWLEQWQQAKTDLEQNVLPYTNEYWNSINNSTDPQNVTMYVGPPKNSLDNVTDVEPRSGYVETVNTSNNPDFKTAVGAYRTSRYGDPSRQTPPPTGDYEFMPEYDFDLYEYAAQHGATPEEHAWLNKAIYKENRDVRMQRPEGGPTPEWMRRSKAANLQDQAINQNYENLSTALGNQVLDWQEQMQPWLQHYGDYQDNNQEWNSLRKLYDADREQIMNYTRGLDDALDGMNVDTEDWVINQGPENGTWQAHDPNKYQGISSTARNYMAGLKQALGGHNDLNTALNRFGNKTYTTLEHPDSFNFSLPELNWTPYENPYGDYISKARRQQQFELMR